MESWLYPRRVARQLTSDPWLLLRILLCIGVFVGFAFWDRLNLNQVRESRSTISDDKFVEATSWLHTLFVENPTRVPVVGAHVLAFVYLFIMAQLAIYIQTGDFIFPAVLISWMLALFITWLTPLPLSPDAIRYAQSDWFVLERFVTDTTVSWHLMMLLLAIVSVCRVYPYYPMYLLSALVFVLTAVYLFATRNAYAVSLLLAVFCAGMGLTGQHVLRVKYEDYVKRRSYEQMKDTPQHTDGEDEDVVMMDSRKTELAKALADEFESSEHRNSTHQLEFRQSDGEIMLDDEYTEHDDSRHRKEEEDEEEEKKEEEQDDDIP